VSGVIEVYEATDIGCVRQTNEDSELVFEPAVYVAADGMGGYAAGEVASRLLVDTVRGCLAGHDVIGTADLRDAVLAGNRSILNCVARHPEYQGMGTTATILHLESGEARWAHVGDSRLYLLRDNELRQITRDHSYVEGLVARGTITREEARSHPKKNMLLRAVGIGSDLDVDTGSFPLADGDVFLLATDGLTNMVDDSSITALLRIPESDPAKALVAEARRCGGRDNITALVVKWHS